MKKIISPFYFSILTAIIIFVAAITIYDTNHNTRQYYSFDSSKPWNDYEVTGDNELSVVTGTIIIDNLSLNQLSFYTTHQNVKIYCNEQLLYVYPVENNNPFSESSGYTWHSVSLPEGENNLSIEITAAYPSYINRIPDFWLGNALIIMTKIFDTSIITFLICTVVFLLGVLIIIFWLILKIKGQNPQSLIYLGVFALLLSTWSINESQLSTLFFKNNIGTSYYSFLSLLLLPVPFAQYVKYFYKSNSKLWDYFCLLSSIQALTCFLLQAFKIADLRETVWTTHVVLALLTILVIFFSVKSLISKTTNKFILIHFICVLIYSASLVLDLAMYYIGRWDNNTFGRFALVIYFVVVGSFAIKECTDLMRKGTQTKAYELLAFTDALTGIKNRTAFMRDLNSCSGNFNDIGVINLDINNLKRTNDNYGHLCGDQYIIAISKIISDVLGNIGECYRIGGDEFEVIVKNASIKNLPSLLEELDKKIQETPWEGKHSWMDIAHGYAIFDSSLDSTLTDTFKRADTIMYSNKESKKSGAN